MELVAFVAQNAATGIFGGMGLATLSIFAPKFFMRRFSSRGPIPLEKRIQVQNRLTTYNELFRKAENAYDMLETNLVLAYPETPFSALNIDDLLNGLRMDHTSGAEKVADLFSSNMKEKERNEVIKDVLKMLEERIEMATNGLHKISQKQKVLDAQLQARNQMLHKLAQIRTDVENARSEITVLNERYDPLYLADIPETIYVMEETIQEASEFFDADKDKFFNSAAEIRSANDKFEEAVRKHDAFMETMNTLKNFQRTAIKETQVLKKVLSLKDAVTPAELRRKDAALKAIYEAQTHTYDSGHPHQVMTEILRPVYAYLEA